MLKESIGPKSGHRFWDESDASAGIAMKEASNLPVRLASRADLDALADLWVASWQAVMPKIDFTARRSWFLAHVRDMEAQGAATICAFAGDALLGFMLLDRERRFLEQIAVRPDRFGTGVGALLLEEAKRLCPAGLALEVNVDNSRALRFYEKSGFEPVEAGVNPNSGLKTWRVRWLSVGRSP